MSPRERAVALKWRKAANDHFPHDVRERLWVDGRGRDLLFPWRPASIRHLDGCLGWHLMLRDRTLRLSSDEDEALGHALLLLDVWLS